MSRSPQPDAPSPRAARPRHRAKLGRAVAGLLSVVGHVAVLLGLLSLRTEPPMTPEPEPISVALVEPRPVIAPPPKPPVVPDRPAAPKAAPRSSLKPAPTPPPPEIEPLPANHRPAPEPSFELGEGELAGAATAGSGAGRGGDGEGCDMVRLLQTALRKNPRVQAALLQAHPDTVASGKAVLVWNGDWVRSPSQTGKGLAGVREVMILEIAFAPEACRADPVRGLVLISLSDAPGAARIALGTGQWRWSDLVFAHGTRLARSRQN
ncbi:hypothetical protein BH10PSE4_BH10PSE4_34510 [soil metagenome]